MVVMKVVNNCCPDDVVIAMFLRCLTHALYLDFLYSKTKLIGDLVCLEIAKDSFVSKQVWYDILLVQVHTKFNLKQDVLYNSKSISKD